MVTTRHAAWNDHRVPEPHSHATPPPTGPSRALRVTGNTPGIFTVDPGCLDRWSLAF
ncbi:hypothetical protein ABZT03_21185 [Streptomyces sp. NPDC005574]|uniref:hypothetical protein n=1 Tax=Streptomyces sp. NPDC005574 TaxID=3156891 RepID=UPI0033A697E8